ncbi:MAG: BTAD domain-containing putative transcriptional regulator [Thermoleophilaceae bacterium]
MEFRLLGPLEVVTDDGAADVGAGKRRALLTYLLINADEVVSAERLIDGLWGEHAPATAAKSVHVYVSQLRKALHANGDLLVTRGSGYELKLGAHELDSRLFEQRLIDARAALEEGDARRAAGLARHALELWRGPALYDVAYESFAQNEASRLEELRLVALEARIDAELMLGEHGRIVGELESLLAEHPLRERFRAQLMLALYRCGRQSEALDVYRTGSRVLMDELGLEPTPELRELEQQILNQSSDLKAPRSWRPTARAEGPPALTAEAQRHRRGALLVAVGGLLLAVATGFALLARTGGGSHPATIALNLAPNSAVGIDVGERRAVAALPLPGRPTDLAASGGTLWITTVDSASVSAIDMRTRKITRTVPLGGRPDAAVASAGSVWVADGTNGRLARIKAGYDTVQQRVSFPAASPRSVSSNRARAPRATLAAAGGAIWITNGSRSLVRVDPRRGRVSSVAVGRPVSAVAAGAGALWALSSASATVLRIDPQTGRVTDRVPIVARQGPDAPAPTAIAAAGESVWILNGNTATVTRIDPRTRGVDSTVRLGIDRIPADIAAAGATVWIADRDGTLSRIEAGSSTAKAIWIGGSLERVAASRSGVWATTVALDQGLPGGDQ